MILPTDFHNWGFGPWLVRNTCDYYLAMDAYLEAENTKHPDMAVLERDWRSLAHGMAEEMTRYLVLACGGEMRHCKSFSTLNDRFRTWRIVVFALNGQPNSFVADTLDRWGALFVGKGNFGGGFGGRPWAQACTMTAEWLRGDCSDVMFVELALNLHHNNSCIFNKLELDALAYNAILNAGGAASETLRRERWPVILKHGSPEWRERWRSLLGHLESAATTEPDIASLAPGSAPKKATATMAAPGTEKLW